MREKVYKVINRYKLLHSIYIWVDINNEKSRRGEKLRLKEWSPNAEQILLLLLLNSAIEEGDWKIEIDSYSSWTLMKIEFNEEAVRKERSCVLWAIRRRFF